MNLIIFDFEVFKYDVLLGIYIVDNDNRQNKRLFQTWDKEEIKAIYEIYKDDIWIGHNNKHYDNHILEAILFNKDPYNVSQRIIKSHIRRVHINYPLNYFDICDTLPVKLKLTEAYWGKKIHLSDVDFNINRPLTEQEKQVEQKYNQADLEQTYENFIGIEKVFDLKLALMNDFNLDYEVLNQSISNISARILNVQKNLSKMTINPVYQFPQLQINNYELLNWYVNQKYLTEKFNVSIDGIIHTIARGGLHAARENFYSQSDEQKQLWYFDVSGYYNLLMINYNLFSRSMSDEAKSKYTQLYYQQLALKQSDPAKRQRLKTILLAVFGATNNQYTEYYDPHHFEMITLNGQLFLIDLLEKLQTYVKLVQTNTDGIIVEIEKQNENKAIEIIDEWQNRTGFTLKREKLNKIFQRDVNNYIIQKANGEYQVIGEALKHSQTYLNPYDNNAFSPKEPIIISILLREFLINKIPPEKLINEYKDNLRLFQFIIKKDSFSKLVSINDAGEQEISEISRAFPWNKGIKNVIYKDKPGKRMKIPILPESSFIYNEDIRDKATIKKLQKEIDYNWYIQRVYERASDFME